MKDIISALNTAADLAANAAADKELADFISRTAAVIVSAFESEHKLLCCGNGGSAADAMHFAEEFSGRFRADRKPLPALALADAAYLTCVANDYGFDDVFSRGIQAFGKNGDVFIGLSTSGNSPNIVKAVQTAVKLKMKTILLLGKEGGKAKDTAQLQYIAPGNTTDRIQEIHMMILHIIIETVERRMFPQNYQV